MRTRRWGDRPVAAAVSLACARPPGRPPICLRAPGRTRHRPAGGWPVAASVSPSAAATGRPPIRPASQAMENTSRPTIPVAAADRLFHPFRFLAADRTSLGDGLDLGLSIVQAIANAPQCRHHRPPATRRRPHVESSRRLMRPAGGLPACVPRRACGGVASRPRSRSRRMSARMTREALRAGAPMTPPPGWVPDPHRYSPRMGVR